MIDKPILLASFQVGYRIAKNNKPHAIEEDLIKPCAIELAETVFGKQHPIKIAQIP